MEVSFPRRFRGPLTSANGGYAAGALAAFLDGGRGRGDASPSASPGARARRRRNGDGVGAPARRRRASSPKPASPSWTSTRPSGLLRRRRAGLRCGSCDIGNPEFRECFVCGVRTEHDGLGNLRRSGGRSRAAACSAVDGLRGVTRARVGRDRLSRGVRGGRGRERRRGPRAHDRTHRSRARSAASRCVVVSWPLGEDGRKLFAGTALFAEGGELLAIARQVWIAPR